MEVLYFKSAAGNFGDDLNESMWKAVLPPDVFEADDALLLGVGSILNAEQAGPDTTRGKRVFVLGTGAGYGPLPPDWRTWTILAVRGPLTAALLERPELAVTDSAAIMATLPAMAPLSPGRDLTLFIPHHHSMVHGQWAAVAERAGLTFMDPRWSLSKVIDSFSRAKLVVTEAMHGAILADTFRIPWIPVLTSPDVLPFKWRDWTLSLNLPYKPLRLPASAYWERHHHRFLVRKSGRAGLIASGLLNEVASPEYLLMDFKERYAKSDGPRITSAPPSGAKRWLAPLRPCIHSTLEKFDPFFIDHSAKVLETLTHEKPYLSDDAVFDEKLGQLRGAVERLVRLIRA